MSHPLPRTISEDTHPPSCGYTASQLTLLPAAACIGNRAMASRRLPNAAAGLIQTGAVCAQTRMARLRGVLRPAPNLQIFLLTTRQPDHVDNDVYHPGDSSGCLPQWIGQRVASNFQYGKVHRPEHRTTSGLREISSLCSRPPATSFRGRPNHAVLRMAYNPGTALSDECVNISSFTIFGRAGKRADLAFS